VIVLITDDCVRVEDCVCVDDCVDDCADDCVDDW
jgi:hypothetical protein